MSKKYTLWHSSYIDLVSMEGVASVFLESEGQIEVRAYMAKQQTTINELALFGVQMGLVLAEEGDVAIKGVNKYVDQALHRLSSWMKEDGEIDTKAHSAHLKSIWALFQAMSKTGRNATSEFFPSRSYDPMLWATSQHSREQYRKVQEEIIQKLKFPEMIYYMDGEMIEKETFLKMELKNKPLTQIQFEKRMIKRRAELAKAVSKTDNSNVISIVRTQPAGA